MSENPVEGTETRRKVKTKKRSIQSAPGEKSPEKLLIAILGRKGVKALAFICLGGAASLCLLGVFWPTVVPSQTARFFLCLLIASLFSVFFFALFPVGLKLELKSFRIPVTLIGPAALWIALFIVFLKWLPTEDTATKLFVPASVNDQLPYSNTWVLSWDPVEPIYHKVRVSDDQNNSDPTLPVGFYVQFDKAHDKYIARVGVGPSSEEIRARYELIFNRGLSTYQSSALPNGGVEKK